MTARPLLGLVLPLLLLDGLGGARAQAIRPEPPVAAPVFGAVALGAVGMVGGALVGYALNRNCNGEFCGLGGFVLGGLAGEMAGVALGAHVGNRGRGSFGLDLLVSMGAGAAGVGIIALSENNNTGSSAVAWFLAPVAQVATTVLVERSIGRTNERGRAATISVVPMPRRRVGIVASVPLP